MAGRKLPIGGVQTFRHLRNENYSVYIDKTKHIYEMASKYKAVFLARPRRFGKSLFCSTIESFFRGEKDLFECLYVHKSDWEWKEHPVIHLEMAAQDYSVDSVTRLMSSLSRQLNRICRSYGVPEQDGNDISTKFANVIYALYEKLGSVVVIIDEYDYPLINTLSHPDSNEVLREVLKGFYGVFKQNDQYLRFVFVTGITKFGQTSMFSGFNQPRDISMDPRYSDVCGITQEELENYFEPEINSFAPQNGGREAYLEKMRVHYNGYYFSYNKKAVYNTYGILNHFESNGKFLPYWSMSGYPTLLKKYLEVKNVDSINIENAKMDARGFDDYKDDTITLFPLLYQAGYLTIKDYNERTGQYTLNYPNMEIRNHLAQFFANGKN